MKRTPLRRVGKKSRRDAQEMRAARLVLLERSGGRCEGRGFSDLCTGVGTEAHHLCKRSRGGTNDPSNLVWLCHFCHVKTETNPAEALVAGLLVPSWGDAA